MTSTFGKKIVTTIFGGSHDKTIGVVVDGLPLGFKIDMDALDDFLRRRAPGRSEFTTPRLEKDKPEFIAGIIDDTIVSTTIAAVIKNTNQNSAAYKRFADVPRPSHADYVSYVKYDGKLDMRGSGSFSGRLTAPLCIAGGIAKQVLESKGIKIYSHIKNIGGIEDEKVDYVNPDMDALRVATTRTVPAISEDRAKEMGELILKVKEEKDSLGGIVECLATGLPVGLGEPNYAGFESLISSGIFAIPGVRGIEFGDGFASAAMRGSSHNDAFVIEDGKVWTKTNHAGGINGGITNGMPLAFSVAMKPTPSIEKEQESFSLSERKARVLEAKGRHDPCISLRALPVIESVTALVILDLMEVSDDYKRF
ncbi:MAG: chorismate synthase [Finegoldia sp.]|nr:chorismate synthase [Finegoldia sp.]